MEESVFDLYESLGEEFWYATCRQDLIKKILESHVAALGKQKNKKKSGKRPWTILDAGCGSGMNYKALEKFGKVISLDVNERAIRICKSRGFKNVFKGDAQSMKMLKSNSFDLVCAMELIEHLPKDHSFINEAHRILRKGGFLLITTPTFKFLWSEDDELGHHERRYSRKQLKALVKNKFNIHMLNYRYFFLFPFSVCVFLMLRLKNSLGGKKANSLSATPKMLNSFLNSVMSVENSLISRNVHLPFGVGLVMLCEKR
jgi:SAM-dependent methyltransferase